MQRDYGLSGSYERLLRCLSSRPERPPDEAHWVLQPHAQSTLDGKMTGAAYTEPTQPTGVSNATNNPSPVDRSSVAPHHSVNSLYEFILDLSK